MVCLRLPDDKIIFYKNKLYGNINNNTSELSPLQLETYTITKTSQTYSSTMAGTVGWVNVDVNFNKSDYTSKQILLLQFKPNILYCSCNESYTSSTNITCTANKSFTLQSGVTQTKMSFGSVQLTSSSMHKINCTPAFGENPLYLYYNGSYVLFPLASAGSQTYFSITANFNSKYNSSAVIKAYLSYTISMLCYIA